MNSIIQSARAHYGTLPPHIKDRSTAKHLLAVIQEAERLESEMALATELAKTLNQMIKDRPKLYADKLVDSQPVKA